MNDRTIAKAIVFLVITSIIVVVLTMWLYPEYNVYASRKQGESLLAHAQSAKEVAVAEARAKMESAQLLADAEVTRATGVAKANKIIGDSLKDNESYLRYLWVNNLERINDTQIIYIPTEAGMPIMEAGRRPKLKPVESAESK